MNGRALTPVLCLLLATLSVVLPAQEHQSLEDAWWTGPMLAPSAASLPAGHFLVEPYLFVVSGQGFFDGNGVRRSVPHTNSYGSLTYMLYGVTNRVTVGLIPTGSYNTESGASANTGGGMGDLTLQAQYRLTQFHPGRHLPTLSLAMQETLPTGRYDRLGNHSQQGIGSGAYSTLLALYSQNYFWLPNGRILRARLNASQTFSRDVHLQDASVYGTTDGFRGIAMPGRSFFFDAAWEYSLTRRWVVALDATYGHQGNTRVLGTNTQDLVPENFQTGTSDAFGLAPAVEYNFTSKLGVLLGTRIIPAGRNTSATITPALAINFVH